MCLLLRTTLLKIFRNGIVRLTQKMEKLEIDKTKLVKKVYRDASDIKCTLVIISKTQ